MPQINACLVCDTYRICSHTFIYCKTEWSKRTLAEIPRNNDKNKKEITMRWPAMGCIEVQLYLSCARRVCFKTDKRGNESPSGWVFFHLSGRQPIRDQQLHEVAARSKNWEPTSSLAYRTSHSQLATVTCLADPTPLLLPLLFFHFLLLLSERLPTVQYSTCLCQLEFLGHTLWDN